jgi:hypothetical protein
LLTCLSAKDDSFAAVNQDTMLEMRADGAGEHDCFEVTTFAGEIGNRVAV